MKLFYGKSVRRNVTLDGHVAETLERLSKISGLTQGSIIEMALDQPFMYRLMCFASDDNESPIAGAMDMYQANGEMNMRQEITEGFVRVLQDSIMTKPLLYRMDVANAANLNYYLYDHMGLHGVDALPGFKELRQLAKDKQFLACGCSSDLKRSEQNIRDYISTMLLHIDKIEVYENDYLIRNLVVIFRDFVADVADPKDPLERRAYYYKSCANVLRMLFPLPYDRSGNWLR